MFQTFQLSELAIDHINISNVELLSPWKDETAKRTGTAGTFWNHWNVWNGQRRS